MHDDADPTPLSDHDAPWPAPPVSCRRGARGRPSRRWRPPPSGSARMPVICFAPQYVCEALLRADGFTDVRYVDTTVPNASGRPRARQVRFPIELAARSGHRDRSRACRSPSSPACMPAATSCSPMAASAASPT